ncbi:MAG TPA: phosphatase PAP2 family protein [Bacteroidia bacterium]|nr:phosphatase PAP2 family protein [Bacteroidia bacterium]
MKSFSKYLSVQFHPLLMVCYAAAIYLYLLPLDGEIIDSRIRLILMGFLLCGTVFIPLFLTMVILRFSPAKSMQMTEPKERNWPLLFTAVVYFFCYFSLTAKQVPVFVKLFLLGSIAGILLSLLINLRWKISLHMTGIGGLCGAICAILLLAGIHMPWLAAGSFLLAGMLGTARLYLDAHSPQQVAAGFFLGFALEFSTVFFLLEH